MAPLTIYKASAGSGKTFKLTLGYLELLFRDPLAYRHILAVTFTNKAASEMKARILERLFSLSVDGNDDASEDMLLLMASSGKSREEIKQISRELLIKILNDYSRFSVGTIDKFFQGVIRAFSREIGLDAGFNLELDKDRVLAEAIDRMFMTLGEDKELLDWLLNLAESRIEEAKAWNFRAEIKNLGDELFSENYQQIMMERDEDLSREQLKGFIEELDKLGQSSKEGIIKIADESINAMNAAGYTSEDFLRKSGGLAAYFEKVVKEERLVMTSAQKSGRFELGKWISKNESDPGKIRLVEETLMPAFQRIYEILITYNSVSEVRQYIYALGIMADLSEHILEITDEKNLFLLSNASRFLKGLIGDNPTPFIYEKTGNSIDHIMLDEFQDTSVFQWENFRPLLDHTLSLGKENIVVGDVKQSIYRWRNSDWKILAEVLGQSFIGQPVKELSLDQNWRSSEHIIRFNNTLFKAAPEMIGTLIDNAMDGALVSEEFRIRWSRLLEAAYSNVEQQVPEKALGTGGYIKGEVLAEEGRRLKELALEKLPEWIRNLQDASYAASDIAILVRTNREGAEVTEMLMEAANDPLNEAYNFGFVSNDSLFLNSNPAVKFLISLLSYLNDPVNDLNSLTLRYYYRYLKSDKEAKHTAHLGAELSVEEELGPQFSQLLAELKRLPLFELVEKLIELFELDKALTDLPYIQAFQEITLEIQQDEPGSLHDFLTYWSEFGIKKSITVSEEQDAIRIITIHKAKGLQYKAVLLPFCDWSLSNTSSGNRDTIIWCRTEGTPFASVPVVPVKFKKDIIETFFAANYLEELIMGYVDNLNLLYVALTRAEEALIIGLPEMEKEGSLKKAGHLIMQLSHSPQLKNDLSPFLTTCFTEVGFEIGNLPEYYKPEQAQAKTWKIDRYPVSFRNDRLRLRMKSSEYFLKDDTKSWDHLDFGNIMHEIFGLIQSLDDVDAAVEKYRRRGLIRQKEAEMLKNIIREKLCDKEVSNWYTHNWKVKNECEIFSGAEIYRPDRVMIRESETIVVDYKFGEKELAKNEQQVMKYCALLEAMNYRHVKGFVWYVMLNKVVKVK